MILFFFLLLLASWKNEKKNERKKRKEKKKPCRIDQLGTNFFFCGLTRKGASYQYNQYSFYYYGIIMVLYVVFYYYIYFIVREREPELLQFVGQTLSNLV